MARLSEVLSCLQLLHDHPKRDDLLNVLIDAGESAWARGAHEVSHEKVKGSFSECARLASNPFFDERPGVVTRGSLDGESTQDV